MSLIVAVVVRRVLVFAGLVSAAASDVARRVIPNWLVPALGGCGAIFRRATAGRRGVWVNAGTAGMPFVVLWWLSAPGVPSDDVKLVTAIVLEQPPATMVSILLGSGLAGAMLCLTWDRRRRDNAGPVASIYRHHLELPYATATLAGTAWHELWDFVT
jgi:Flp pilus assembly protein protease CpaA